jgi:hypothetical protein
MPSPSRAASIMSTAGRAIPRTSADKHDHEGMGEMQKRDLKPKVSGPAVFIVMIAALLSSVTCSLFRAGGYAPPVLREDFSVLHPEDFPAKIKQLEDISQSDTSMSVRTRALFYIALAQVHYHNPSPDYPKAVQYLDKYIALETNRKDIDEFVAWKSVVDTLDGSLRQNEKLEKNYTQLRQQYDSAIKNRDLLVKKTNDLGHVIEDQKKELASLKETIKKLDAVQQEIEKKRKGIKK